MVTSRVLYIAKEKKAKSHALVKIFLKDIEGIYGATKNMVMQVHE